MVIGLLPPPPSLKFFPKTLFLAEIAKIWRFRCPRRHFYQDCIFALFVLLCTFFDIMNDNCCFRFGCLESLQFNLSEVFDNGKVFFIIDKWFLQSLWIIIQLLFTPPSPPHPSSFPPPPSSPSFLLLPLPLFPFPLLLLLPSYFPGKY